MAQFDFQIFNLVLKQGFFLVPRNFFQQMIPTLRAFFWTFISPHWFSQRHDFSVYWFLLGQWMSINKLITKIQQFVHVDVFKNRAAVFFQVRKRNFTVLVREIRRIRMFGFVQVRGVCLRSSLDTLYLKLLRLQRLTWVHFEYLRLRKKYSFTSGLYLLYVSLNNLLIG